MFETSIKKAKHALELAVNRRFRLSKTSVYILDNFIEALFERVLYESRTMFMKAKTTLDADAVNNACYVAFSGQLGRQMRSAAQVEVLTKKDALFSPRKLHRRMKADILMRARRVSPKAAVALALAFEFFTSEILMYAYDHMTMMNSKMVKGW
jgi:hypothetical protein